MITFKRTASILLAIIVAITLYSPVTTQAQGYGPRLSPPEGALPGQRDSGNRGEFKIRRLDEEGNVLGPNDNPDLAATIQVVEEFQDGSFRVTTVKEVKPSADKQNAPTATTQPTQRNDTTAAAASTVNPALLPTMGLIPQRAPQSQSYTRGNINYNEPAQPTRPAPEAGRTTQNKANSDDDYDIDYSKHKEDILARLDLMGDNSSPISSPSRQVAARTTTAPEQPTRQAPPPAAISTTTTPAPATTPTPVTRQAPPMRTPTPTPIVQQTPPNRTPSTTQTTNNTPQPKPPQRITNNTSDFDRPAIFQTQPTTRTSSTSLPPAPPARTVQETLNQAKQRSSQTATSTPTRQPASTTSTATTSPTKRSELISMRPLTLQRTDRTELAPLPTADALQRAQRDTTEEARSLTAQQNAPTPAPQTTKAPETTPSTEESTAQNTYAASKKWDDKPIRDPRKPRRHRSYMDPDSLKLPDLTQYAKSDAPEPEPTRPKPEPKQKPELKPAPPQPTQVAADTPEPKTETDKDITKTSFGRAVSSTWSDLKTGVGGFFKRSPDSATSRKVSREPTSTLAANQASIKRLDTEPHFLTEATDQFSASPEDYRYWAGYLPKVGPLPLRFASAIPEYDRSMLRFDRRQLVPLAAKIEKPNVQLPEPEPEQIVPQPPRPRPDLFPVSDNEMRALDVNRFVQDLSRVRGQDNDVNVPFIVPYQQNPQTLQESSRAIYRQVP